jgi:hypothetical protein
MRGIFERPKGSGAHFQSSDERRPRCEYMREHRQVLAGREDQRVTERSTRQ